MTKVYAHQYDPSCPKCRSHAVGTPVFHFAGFGWYFAFWFPLLHWCDVRALDHLHFHCASCSFSFATACADIKEDQIR